MSERPIVRHGVRTVVEHREGDHCPNGVCQSTSRVVERALGGGYVYLSASAVHAHDCPNWRMGTRHGPCRCGAAEAWERQRQTLVDIVWDGHALLAVAKAASVAMHVDCEDDRCEALRVAVERLEPEP